MIYGDCREGMRVRVRDNGKLGTIERCHAVLRLEDRIARKPAGVKVPGVVFNMISVRYDAPDRGPGGLPVQGVTLDPSEVDALS